MKLHASEITGSLSIKGTITPDGSGSHDLGTANNPWKDIHVMSSSIHVYDSTGPIAKMGAIRGKGFVFKDHTGALARISGSALKVTGDAKVGGTATADEFVGGGAGITGVTAEWDGTHAGDGNITGTLTFGSLTDGTITIADFKDQDDMSSNSATSLSTQQSIKAYVDSQVTAQDLDFQGDSGGALAIDLDSESLTIAGGTNATTVGSGNGVTINVDDAFLINSGNDTTSGTITAAGFIGDVTGNTSGTALTVTQAAQGAITSLGTLTSLDIDNININGNTISSTAGTDLLITPLGGQQIVLDGAIIIDAGVVTGATSITSTAFVGDITGDVTGNADTVTTNANLTGDVTSTGNATAIAAGVIINADVKSDAAIAYSKLGSIPTWNQSTTGNAATATILATTRTIGGVSFNGSAAINLPGVNAAGNQDTSGNAATATKIASITNSNIVQLAETQTLTNKTLTSPTLTTPALGTPSALVGTNISGTAASLTAGSASVSDSTANTNFPVVFNDESNVLLDDTGTLYYNPSTGLLRVPNLSVTGTTTTIDSAVLAVSHSISFEGSTADLHETILTVVEPTQDNTIYLPNIASGYLPVLAVASATAISSTPAELNLLDGSVANTVVNSKGVVYGSGGEVTATNVTGSLKGNVLGDVTGALTGNATTATTLATARAINGVDFNGSAAITVTAAAGTLTGATLASGVTASSLTSTGTLASFRSTGIDDNADALAITIDSSERVGIGIASPDAPLHISGGTGMTGSWGRTLTLAHNFPGIAFQSEYSTDAWAYIGYDNTTGMKFFVNADSNDVTDISASLTILDSGNIGIGTESPDGRLHICDGSEITSTYGDGNTLIVEDDDGTGGITIASTGQGELDFADAAGMAGRLVYNHDSNYMSFDTAGSERMRILNSGNVGIGTASPTHKLSVYGGSDNATGGIQLYNDDSGGAAATDGTTLFQEQNTNNFYVRNYENASIIMRTNDTTALTLDNSQNATFAGDILLTSGTDYKPQLVIENTNANDRSPYLVFKKNSASPANNDGIGLIEFYGRDNNSSSRLMASIEASSPNVTDYDGKITFSTVVGGTMAARMLIDETGYVNFNHHSKILNGQHHHGLLSSGALRRLIGFATNNLCRINDEGEATLIGKDGYVVTIGGGFAVDENSTFAGTIDSGNITSTGTINALKHSASGNAYFEEGTSGHADKMMQYGASGIMFHTWASSAWNTVLTLATDKKATFAGDVTAPTIDIAGHCLFGDGATTMPATAGSYSHARFGKVGMVQARDAVDAVGSFGLNFYYDASGANRYLESTFANRFKFQDGGMAYEYAPSGTAGAALTFVSAFSINTSGNATFGANVILDNGGANGANLTLASSGNTAWELDNSSGTFRLFRTGGLVGIDINAAYAVTLAGTLNSGAITSTGNVNATSFSTAGIITTGTGDSVFGSGESDSRIYISNRGSSSGDDSHFIRGDGHRLHYNAGGSNGEVWLDVNGGNELKITDGTATFAGDIKTNGKVLLNNSDGEGHFSTGDITTSNTIGNDEATFLAVGNQPEWGFQYLASDGDVGMGIYHTNGGTSNWSMKFGRGLNNSNDFVKIYTNNTEQFKIANTGVAYFSQAVVLGHSGANFITQAEGRYYFDGGSDSYMTEYAGDQLKVVAGGQNAMFWRDNNTTIPKDAKLFFDGTSTGVGSTYIWCDNTDEVEFNMGGTLALTLSPTTAEFTGNVGIGTTAFGANEKLKVIGTQATAGTAHHWNIHSDLTTASSGTQSDNQIIAVRGQTNTAGSFIHSATTSPMRGGYFGMYHGSTGTIASMRALEGRLYLAASKGTVTEAEMLRAEWEVGSGTTITYLYGLRIKNVGGTGGTETNSYGVHIGAMQGVTNSYGIYQESTADKNYFGGKVGIGTTAPTISFVVAGMAGISSQLHLGPTAGLAGGSSLYIDPASHNFVVKQYNGSAWVSSLDINKITSTATFAGNVGSNITPGTHFHGLSEGGQCEMWLDSENNATTSFSIIRLRKSVASGGATTDGHCLGGLLYNGHNGSSYVNGVQLEAFQDGAISSGNVPAKFLIKVNSGGGLTTAVTINKDSSAVFASETTVPSNKTYRVGDGNCHFGRNSNDMYLYAYSGHIFSNNSGEAMRMTNSGHLQPGGDNTKDLGSSSYRWRNLYVADMQMNNEGTGGNDIDGTEGSWTIQEGEEDLFVINRKTGKKFKIKLEAV